MLNTVGAVEAFTGKGQVGVRAPSYNLAMVKVSDSTAVVVSNAAGSLCLDVELCRDDYFLEKVMSLLTLSVCPAQHTAAQQSVRVLQKRKKH